MNPLYLEEDAAKTEASSVAGSGAILDAMIRASAGGGDRSAALGERVLIFIAQRRGAGVGVDGALPAPLPGLLARMARCTHG